MDCAAAADAVAEFATEAALSIAVFVAPAVITISPVILNVFPFQLNLKV